jgi:hypothetical protein
LSTKTSNPSSNEKVVMRAKQNVLVRNAKSVVNNAQAICFSPSIEAFAKRLIDFANVSIAEICLANIYILRLKSTLPQKVAGTIPL